MRLSNNTKNIKDFKRLSFRAMNVFKVQCINIICITRNFYNFKYASFGTQIQKKFSIYLCPKFWVSENRTSDDLTQPII